MLDTCGVEIAKDENSQQSQNIAINEINIKSFDTQDNKLNQEVILNRIDEEGNSPFKAQTNSTNVEQPSNTNLSARTIWGRVVLALRQNGAMMLHSACGELRDLKLDDNTLIIGVKDEFSFNLLKKPENFQKIELELKKINDKIKLDFVPKFYTNSSSKEEDLMTIKELFGDEIDII